MSYPIIWKPIPASNYYAGRKGQKILAISHHRMVGTLSGTDVVFAKEGANKSSHFGIGLVNGKVEIHQYVKIDHSAFCHGAVAATPSAWRSWGYDPYATNTGTVAIEHQDNGGAPLGKGRGVVPESVLQASIWLDRLLLSGDVAAWKAAGMRAASWANAGTVAKQLAALPVTARTIIDHHDIADYKKPYCWRPWSDDKVGFPRARFIKELSAPAAPPDTSTTGESVLKYAVPKVPQEMYIATGTWLYDNSDFNASAGNIQISPARWLPYFGQPIPGVYAVGYVNASGVASGAAYFVKAAGQVRNVPLTTTADDGIGQAQVDAAYAKGKTDGFTDGKLAGMAEGKEIGWDRARTAFANALSKIIGEDYS